VVRRPLVTVAVIAGLAIFVGAVTLLLDARKGDGGAVATRPRASVSVVSAAIRPATHHFGEPVVAELVVVADKSLVDPSTVRVNPDFTPYEPIGPRQVERTETATSVRWRFRFPLRCLRDGCAPDGARRTIELPGAGVLYQFRTEGRGTAIVDWPSFDVTARVPDDALAPENWRAEVASLPAVTYARSPTTLAAGLLGGSFVFALIGLGLVWWLTRPKETLEQEQLQEEPERLTTLERALQLAREAALDGDSPERRKALERVARELGDRGLPDLADRARALAWASGAASAVAVDDLARDARAAANGGAP
jgi:hypothetical protein